MLIFCQKYTWFFIPCLESSQPILPYRLIRGNICLVREWRNFSSSKPQMAWLFKYLPNWSFAKMSPLASIHMYIKFEYALMYVHIAYMYCNQSKWIRSCYLVHLDDFIIETRFQKKSWPRAAATCFLEVSETWRWFLYQVINYYGFDLIIIFFRTCVRKARDQNSRKYLK